MNEKTYVSLTLVDYPILKFLLSSLRSGRFELVSKLKKIVEGYKIEVLFHLTDLPCNQGILS
jgi:hypothetical protein